MTETADQTKQETSSFKKLAVVVVLLGLVRVYTSVIDRADMTQWRFGAHTWKAWLVLAAASALLSAISVMLARRWFGSLVTVLFATAIGALGTSLFASMPGALIGLAVGIVGVAPFLQSALKSLAKAFLTRGIFAVGAAMLAGFAFGISGIGHDTAVWMAPAIIAGLCLAALLACAATAKKDAGSSRSQYLAQLAFRPMSGVLLTLAGWVAGLELENRYTHLRLSSFADYAAVPQSFGDIWFRDGISSVEGVTLLPAARDEDLRIFSRLPGLNFLWLDCEKVTDAGFQHVAACPSLQSVWVEKAGISDAGLAALKGLANLRQLCLNDLPLTDQGIRNLGYKPFLETLALSNSRITGESLWHISRFRSLSTLALNGTDVNDGSLAHLSQLPLRSLALQKTSINGPGLAHLAGIRQLQTLDIGHTNVKPEHLAVLAKLPRLADLEMPGLPVSRKTLDILAQIKYLASVNLTESGISDDLAGRLRFVHHVMMDCANVQPSTIQKMKEQESQVDLFVTNIQLTPEHIRRLVAMPDDVTCIGCSVSNEALETLKSARAYVRLYFQFPKASPAQLEELKSCRNATVLRFRGR